jgi:heat shock protein HslJ
MLAGRTMCAPDGSAWLPVVLLIGAVATAGCARVTSPQETAMPTGAPAPAAEQPVVAPVDTTEPPEPPEQPPEDPLPPEEPAPEPALETRALTDARWRLTDLGDEPIVTGAPTDREPYLQLSADGTTVNGATGCNTFSGPYTLTGDALSFGTLITTKVACTDPAWSDQEQRFLSALSMADRFELNGDVLILYAGMSPVARFEADSMP